MCINILHTHARTQTYVYLYITAKAENVNSLSASFYLWIKNFFLHINNQSLTKTKNWQLMG